DGVPTVSRSASGGPAATLGLALHLHARAGKAHHELERLVTGVANAVEPLGRRHDAERSRADRTHLVADAHLALPPEDEEALLDVAVVDLVPVHRDLLSGIDLCGAERQLRRSLRRIEVDRTPNAGDHVADRLVGPIGYTHSADNPWPAETPLPSPIS